MSGTRGLLPIALIAVLLAGAASVGACGGDDDDAPPPVEPDPEPEPEPEEPDERESAVRPLDFDRVETVAEGLEVPWDLAFLDRKTILVTERPGRVRLIEGDELRPEPVAEIDGVAHQGEGGLLGIALHPRFPEPRAAYLYYTAGGENRISRFRLDQQLGFAGEEILLTTPAASIHNGGQLAFGPEGLLCAATGDAGAPEIASDRDSPGGKILRVRPDGSPPADNPFDDSPVLSFGHRNPQGFDWDSAGRMYSSEHGPTGEFGLCCHDEINLIEEGEFYGWPQFAGEATAAGGEPPQPQVAPLAESGPDDTWAPGGLAVHEPAGEPTELLVPNLRGERLMRVVLEGPQRVDRIETELDELGRLRAAVIGPDRCLYLTTSDTDGRGSPRPGDDRVVRVCERD